METIKYQTEIEIKNIPIQWISKIELYYPDLPQFPITYIHIVYKGKRVYGFPVSASFEHKKDKICNMKLIFLSNIPLKSRELKERIELELRERIGETEKISEKDIKQACKGNKEHEKFFIHLWKYIEKTYGKFIPYGRYFEEVFSIVRFVSAWQPKTGKQSEMRMLYNFLSIFGEEIEIEGDWDFLEFFILPTYEDVLNKNFNDFPRFKNLYNAIEKIWKIYFNQEFNVAGTKLRSMEKSFPINKDSFIEKISSKLHKEKKITMEEKVALDRLVDAFNRHAWRACFFTWSIMSIFDKDYYTWEKEFFTEFYIATNSSKKTIGISPKVVACFLQQGFKNDEVIPIDTWVEAFYKHALGISDKEDFFNEFDKLGKIERVIWLASQANKTNVKNFFDTLWCTRYGTTGNGELRRANPISCYECKLRTDCPGYNKIKKSNVLIIEKNVVKIVNIENKKGKITGKKIDSKDSIEKAENNKCKFICVLEDSVPKKIFIDNKKTWELIDEFSGYILKDQKIKIKEEVATVNEIITSLPPFKFRN